MASNPEDQVRDNKKKVFLASFSALVNEIFLDDDEEDEMINYFVTLGCLANREYRGKIEGFRTVVIENYAPDRFRQKFRMYREDVDLLCAKLSVHIPIRLYRGGRKQIPLIDKVLITLWYASTQETMRSIGEKFGVTESTTFQIVREVVAALLCLREEYILWRQGEEIIGVVKGFQERSGFPGVIGAVDGTHIPIRKPAENGLQYINRKKFPSIVLQGVCNDRCVFIDCYVGWPGSVHDARVLRNSDVFSHVESGDYFPNNSHLIGDGAYPLSKCLLTPYRDNGHLTPEKKVFNRKLSGTRSTIERSFGLLKGRWRRLKMVDVRHVPFMSDLVMACCVLHNHCLLTDTDPDDFLDADEIQPDTDPVPAGLETADGIDKRDGLAAIFG